MRLGDKMEETSQTIHRGPTHKRPKLKQRALLAATYDMRQLASCRSKANEATIRAAPSFPGKFDLSSVGSFYFRRSHSNFVRYTTLETKYHFQSWTVASLLSQPIRRTSIKWIVATGWLLAPIIIRKSRGVALKIDWRRRLTIKSHLMIHQWILI